MFKVSVTSTHTWSQTVAPLVNRSLDNVLFTVNPSLCEAFLQVTDVIDLCFVHALLHNTSKFYNPQVHFDEACTIRLMQCSLAISHGNITFSLFWVSQRSVATLIRWDGWSSYRYMCKYNIISLWFLSLWPPCVADADIIFLLCGFFLSIFLFFFA